MNRDTRSTQFERDGFIKIPGFLSADELAETRDRLECYKRDTVPGLDAGLVMHEGPKEEGRIKQLVDMQLADSFFAEFIHNPERLALARELLGEEVDPRTVEYFGKEARIGTATPLHQDGFYFCVKPNHALTIWIAMTDCDSENGCLQYVRGSHHDGIIDHEGSGVVGFSQGLVQTEFPPEQVVTTTVNAGDCLVHHSRTIHFAPANESDRPRHALALVYFGVSAKRDEEAWDRYRASLESQRAG